MAFVYPKNKLAPFAGCLLLAQPLLPDSIFSRTAILLCTYDNEETFGLILNKATGFRFETESTKNENNSLIKVYNGGPVETESLFLLHTKPEFSLGAQNILPNLYFGGDYNGLFDDINDGNVREDEYRAFVGYCGWAPGQLEEEIENGTWFVKETNANEILNITGRNTWKNLIKSMGGNFEPLAMFPERDYYN